jgi:hypothetical protein
LDFLKPHSTLAIFPIFRDRRRHHGRAITKGLYRVTFRTCTLAFHSVRLFSELHSTDRASAFPRVL